MMDPLGVNNVLFDDSGDDGFDEANRIDFNSGDFNNIMGNAELDNMLSEENTGADFNFDDDDFEKMLNPDDVDLEGLEGSDGSLDKLATMPIVEVHDDRVEELLGSIAREENIRMPMSSSSRANQERMTERDEMMMMMMADAEPDPLVGKLGNTVSRMSINNNDRSSGGMMMQPSQQHSQQRSQQEQMQQQMPNQNMYEHMTSEVDALQRMIDQAVMEGARSNSSNHNNTVQGMNQMSGLDLEQEKMKLLGRLNEINQRKNNNVSSDMGMGRQFNNAGNPFLQSAGMSQMQNMLRQQQKPATVSSVGGMSGTGETSLTSFLRKNQKSQPSTMAASAGRNMLASNVSGAPKVASIFIESPVEFHNSLLNGNRNQNRLFGAMDRKTASQNTMVRKLSARGPMARSDSGAHMRGGGYSQGFNSGNATWGDGPSASSFKTSGILPRHVSENHLSRASKGGGLVRSRSKAGSMSRENLMYMKRVPRNTSEESLGSLLPVKRRSGAPVSKHKMAISRSVPHLVANNGGVNRGGPTQPGSQMMQADGAQMNAMW